MTNVTFITGNENKARLLSKLLGMEIEYHKLALDEIQSPDPEAVVRHKVLQAYDVLKRPVLVEDTCMGLDELGGLPGPFIKFFIEQENGAEAICRMADGLSSRRATATITFGYYDGNRLDIISNKVHGIIPDHPGKTVSGFGWDTVFVEDGYNGVVRSELDEATYEKLYREAKPIDKVRDFLMKEA